jgi:hypothetical protein
MVLSFNIYETLLTLRRTQAEFLGRRCHMLVVVLRMEGGDQTKSKEQSNYEKFKTQTFQYGILPFFA